jgi:hypothetical protein
MVPQVRAPQCALTWVFSIYNQHVRSAGDSPAVKAATLAAFLQISVHPRKSVAICLSQLKLET